MYKKFWLNIETIQIFRLNLQLKIQVDLRPTVHTPS